MCSPSAPPAPDYNAAAQQQGAANLQTAIAQSVLNRPTEVTPYGTRSWTQSGTTRLDNLEGVPVTEIPNFTSNISFTPEGQALFNKGNQIQQGMADLGIQGVNKAQGILGEKVDFSRAPSVDQAQYGNLPQLQSGEGTRAAVRDAMLSRVNTDISRGREGARSDLISRGIPEGSEAWNRAMEQIDRQETDSRYQAELASTSAANQQFQQDLARRQQGASEEQGAQSSSMAARQQAITEMLAQRSQPLNEINALRSGSQVQGPNFGPAYTGAQVAPAPIMGATAQQGQYAGDIYNAQAGQQGALINGAAMTAAAYFF